MLLYTSSITAGTVVEYFVMVVRTTECSYPAQQSQSECATPVIIMCWGYPRGSTYAVAHLVLFNSTHTCTTPMTIENS